MLSPSILAGKVLNRLGYEAKPSLALKLSRLLSPVSSPEPRHILDIISEYDNVTNEFDIRQGQCSTL
jgi:hypothetical protein